MRLRKSLLNTFAGIFAQLVVLVFSFLSRKVFMDTLGIEALGIHGFLSNIISWLSLADLGIGNAVCYALYEPLEKKNKKVLCSFNNFLKKIYGYICIVYIIIIITLIPFVLYSNKNVIETSVIISVFIAWAFNQLVVLYIYYNTIILIADQKAYKIKWLTILISLLMSTSQILILLKFQNYFLYTAAMLIFTFIQFFLQKIIVDKEYPYLRHDKSILDEENRNKIFEKTRALLLHGIADFILNSTDNIIVLNLLGAKISGIFTSYQLIFHTLEKFLTQIVSGTVSSVGNYLVTETKEKSYGMFLNISLLSNIIFAICAVCGGLLANQFIVIWYGKALFLDKLSVLLLSINVFIMGLRCGPQIFRNAAALYEKDKYIRFAFAFSNLILSLVFSGLLGISGILLATTLNLIGEELLILPLMIIRNQLFKRSIHEYYFNLLRSVLAYMVSMFTGYHILNFITIRNRIGNFIISGSILVIWTFLIFILFHTKTKELNYLFSLVARGQIKLKGIFKK